MTDTNHETGHETLNSISLAKNFNRWMYDSIKDFLRGDILEVGSGIGNISSIVIDEGHQLTVSDIDPKYISILKEKYKDAKNVNGFLSINLEEPNFNETYSSLKDKFDTVFLLNVLEHVHQHKKAIENCSGLLRKEGHLVVLVPAYNKLYSKFDKELGHYRRYTERSLTALFSPMTFAIQKNFYFNALGIAGWSWNKLVGEKSLTANKMRAFEKLVPIAKTIDLLLGNRIGLSVVVIAKKIS